MEISWLVIAVLSLTFSILAYAGFRVYARYRMAHAYLDLSFAVRNQRDHAFMLEMHQVSTSIRDDASLSDWEKFKRFRDARDNVRDLNWQQLKVQWGIKLEPVPGLR